MKSGPFCPLLNDVQIERDRLVLFTMATQVYRKKNCLCCIMNLYCISQEEHPTKLWKKKMLVAMPHIEFKGIPTALEQDSYFDVNKWNLIVFDDQMIDASKDKRIVNLFTRGSHDRNLSVIYSGAPRAREARAWAEPHS